MSVAGDDLQQRARQVIAALTTAGEMLATAESCTGGLIAAALTAVPGASAAYWGGGVVYTEAAKMELAGIAARVLEEHGPVSAATSEALAVHIRQHAAVSYGLAVTGWAGPDAGNGGTVGEVHGALAYDGGVALAQWSFRGDRSAVRAQAAAATLELLQRHLAAAQDGADE